jgi:hypothetical protein
VPDRRIISVKAPLQVVVPQSLPVGAGRFILGHIAARDMLSQDRAAVFVILASRTLNGCGFRLSNAVSLLASRDAD